MKPDEIEQEIQDKGLTAPRVTPQDIESNIACEHYFTAENGIRGASLCNGGTGMTCRLRLGRAF